LAWDHLALLNKSNVTYHLHHARPNHLSNFNSRIGCKHTENFICFKTKLPNLKLKTQPRPLRSSLPLGWKCFSWN